MFPSHIFKAYDLRGIAGEELTEELFYRIGRAAVVYTGAKYVFVGYDMRNSSIAFKTALIAGLTDQGANVADIGLVSTPMLNIMTVREETADLGIMVTASHNPSKYNGCKFINKKTMMPMGLDSGLDQIRDMVEKYEFVGASEKGEVVEKDLRRDYVDFTMSILDTSSIGNLKIVIDMGNGIEGTLIDGFMEKLPVEADYLYKEPDGNFPNHEPNPIKYETLKDLQKRVVEIGADVGFAFDADADRVGLVDEKGNIISGDKITALLAPELLKKYPGANVIYDLRSTNLVKETVEAHGGRPLESRVGHTFIKQLMRQENAVFGGEVSGHFYYKDLFCFESGDLTLLYLLKLLSGSDKKLSESAADLNKYFHSGEINFEVNDKDGILAEIEKKYSPGAKRISKLDGIKIEFDDWWLNVRKSNTDPLLRLNLEANTKGLMEEKKKEISALISSYSV